MTAQKATAAKDTPETPPEPKKIPDQLWEFYGVKIRIRDRLVGGYPKNPDTEAAMLKARGLEDLITPQVDPATLTDEERANLKEATMQKSWTGFKSDPVGGSYLEARCIKAMFKECANILKGSAILNVKNFKSKLAERVFVEPHAIYFGKEPDNTDQRVVHVMTAMGPRSSIKLFDYYEKPVIEFQLKVLVDGVVTKEHLKTILEYAQENGLGADRSQSFGQFDLLEFYPMSAPKPED
jgi:hypothetical protein